MYIYILYIHFISGGKGWRFRTILHAMKTALPEANRKKYRKLVSRICYGCGFHLTGTGVLPQLGGDMTGMIATFPNFPNKPLVGWSQCWLQNVPKTGRKPLCRTTPMFHKLSRQWRSAMDFFCELRTARKRRYCWPRLLKQAAGLEILPARLRKGQDQILRDGSLRP